MAARALIFDLDGTLWNGHGCYATVLASIGGGDPARITVRLESGENVFALASGLGVPRSRFINGVVSRAADLQVYKGVPETLAALLTRGTRLGVVSSLSRTVAEPLLGHHGLGRFFGAMEFAASRKGAAINRALARLGSQGGPSFYVGDLGTDGQAAGRAGVGFAWASWGYGAGCPAGAVHLARFEDVLAL